METRADEITDRTCRPPRAVPNGASGEFSFTQLDVKAEESLTQLLSAPKLDH
jgi:hypothetical protein